ncbi:MAG TPA: winged helix-turn-helix domain-containing protein [Xanthomonadaceae bacterium]|nr:winged helix-turn-helix domain-containing protein [Xanthomonadaceae bacterium]
MPVPSPTAPVQHDPSASARSFRFEGVVLDECAARLLVDGRERPCSTRAFRLLSLLCESPGRVLSRQALLDRLWPGGQVVGDEALTQAVFRARACLGPYAERVVTVRGVGIRLDAEVMEADGAGPRPVPEHGPSPGPTPALVPAPAPPVLTQAARRPRPAAGRRFVAGALLVLLVTVLALWLWPRLQGEPPVAQVAHIDRGYGLIESDAHAAREDTVALLRDAFRYEAIGDRARGSALLETVHGVDPRTPLPAIFLALWASGGGDNVRADHWLEEARPRVAAINAPYVNAFHQYVLAERNGPRQAVLRFAGAVLDLRPEAWQLHLARAHMLMAEGYREAAVQELAAIDFGTLEHRKLVMALADRASLGDIEGAERELARIQDTITDEASLAHLRGRIAWSRGDFAASREAYEASARLGAREARFDIANRGLTNAGLLAILEGDDTQALRMLEQARTQMTATGWVMNVIDISLMLAQLNALVGDMEAAEADLVYAERNVDHGGSANLTRMTRLYRARLGAPGVPFSLHDDDLAVSAMLAAHAALREGDETRARSAYREAERRLPPASVLHEELRWLAARLGEPLPPPSVIDPPYPPMTRMATRAAVQRMLAP